MVPLRPSLGFCFLRVVLLGLDLVVVVVDKSAATLVSIAATSLVVSQGSHNIA